MVTQAVLVAKVAVQAVAAPVAQVAQVVPQPVHSSAQVATLARGHQVYPRRVLPPPTQPRQPQLLPQPTARRASGRHKLCRVLLPLPGSRAPLLLSLLRRPLTTRR